MDGLLNGSTGHRPSSSKCWEPLKEESDQNETCCDLKKTQNDHKDTEINQKRHKKSTTFFNSPVVNKTTQNEAEWAAGFTGINKSFSQPFQFYAAEEVSSLRTVH